MQTHALNNVLKHLKDTFAFDKEETRNLLSMLHKTIMESPKALLSGQTDKIYDKSHKLHSEFHSCGHEELAALAAEIEINAKMGVVEQSLIDDFLSRATIFAKSLEDWLGNSDDN